MAKSSNETLLISAILNTRDTFLAKDLGIRPEHFNGYQNEYQWILNYDSQYRTCPSVTEFLVNFPLFPYDEEVENPGHSARKVKERWAERDIQTRLLRASTLLKRGDVADAYAVFEDCRLEVTTARPKNTLTNHSFLDDYESDYEPRITMPWSDLQERTQGIGPGELWYFAARQGQGKSSFLIDMAVSAAMDGKRVVIYSLEMTKRQTEVRIHANIGRRLGLPVDANAMLRKTFPHLDYKHLLQRISDEVPGEISIHEVAMGPTTPAVVNTNAQYFDLSIIDYIGLMRNDDGVPAIKDYRIIAEISNGLKSTALGKHHAIIAASQINREGVSPHWRPPALHTLAQSDHLGNDGDVVITMKRFGLGASVCSLEKNRHGQSGVCFFTKYDANAGDFSQITRAQADIIKEEDDE